MIAFFRETGGFAFNRTSMELKLTYGVGSYPVAPPLLIEPVWN